MKNLKKTLAFALALTLGLSLAACSSSESSGESAGNNAASSVDTTAYTESANAYTQRLAGLDADTIVFTVNGAEIPADYYLYWLTYDCYYWDYMNQMYYGAELDFSAAVDEETTVGQFLKDDAKDLSAYYVLMELQAEANNCGVTEEQLAEWEQTKADYIATNGQEAFDQMILQTGVTLETFDRISLCSYLYTNLQDTLVGTPSEADLDAYIEENEIYGAKHILILTAVESEDGTVTLATGGSITNEDGSAYTGTAAEYNADALARAEDILAQLNAAEDVTTLFDELMNEYSEDSGLASYPDGYTFTTGEMVSEFEDGTKALEYGEISGLVESTYGYHIILRQRPDVESTFIAEKMDAIVNQWMAEVEVVTNEIYDNLTADTVYTNYKDYQTELAAAAAAETESTETESSSDGE